MVSRTLLLSLNVGETNSSGKVSIFRNTTTPGALLFLASSLAPKVDSLTGGTNCFGVKITDLDSDGKPDIIAGNNSSGNIAVFRNTCTPGNISLASKLITVLARGRNLLSADDLDGDGRADIIIQAVIK